MIDVGCDGVECDTEPIERDAARILALFGLPDA